MGMQQASLYSAMGSSNSGLCCVHAMGKILDSFLNIHYDLACTALLPRVMEYNSLACPDKFINIAKCFGENIDNIPPTEASMKAVAAVEKLSMDIGMHNPLSKKGLTADLINRMAKHVMASDTVNNNPREVTMQDIIQLYKKTFDLISFA